MRMLLLWANQSCEMMHGVRFLHTTEIYHNPVNWISDMRGLLILLCAALSAVAAYYGQPLVRENPEATLVLATVMTVFAGFLVAIIAVLGDPAMIPRGSWRVAEMRHDNLEASVIRH